MTTKTTKKKQLLDDIIKELTQDKKRLHRLLRTNSEEAAINAVHFGNIALTLRKELDIVEEDLKTYAKQKNRLVAARRKKS